MFYQQVQSALLVAHDAVLQWLRDSKQPLYCQEGDLYLEFVMAYICWLGNRDRGGTVGCVIPPIFCLRLV